VNIRQLRFISAVAKHGLNISATAESLYTSQPGVSKQIKQLEDELGVLIFERSGRQLTSITPEGKTIIELADRALIELDTIKRVAKEFSSPGRGHLTIATSHTQAKYVLPGILQTLADRYPQLTIGLHQGTPLQIAQLVNDGAADFAIATESMQHFADLMMLPCYQWQRSILLPKGHPLADLDLISLQDLVDYPLITYVFGLSENSSLFQAFQAARITPKARLTATDASIIKTYVRQGMGVGLLASIAYDPVSDTDLIAIDASHLFAASTTRIGFRRGSYLRPYMYDFIALFAPHLTREVVNTALSIHKPKALDAYFMDLEIPCYGLTDSKTVL